MLFTDVKHQPNALRLIQRAIAGDRVPHAYIYHGPDGVGKELCARGLAELLLCPQPVERSLSEKTGGSQAEQVTCTNGESVMRLGCGVCEDCRMVRTGTHPDWHLIYRQLNRDHPNPDVRRRKGLDIGVDVLRHFVIEKVGRTPVRGRAKVFVIREADRITAQAQNALLKTLEEPPQRTFLILLVRSVERLLATTLSRCQRVGFDALPTSFVRAELARHRPEVPDVELDWYAGFCGGSIGSAIEAVDDELHALNARVAASLAGLTAGDPARQTGSRPPVRVGAVVKLWTELAGALADRYRKRDSDITDTEATRRGLKTILHLSAGRYADELRAHVSRVDPTHARSADITAAAKPVRLIETINRLAEAERQLDLNANVQLVIETLLNDLGGAPRASSVLV